MGFVISGRKGVEVVSLFYLELRLSDRAEGEERKSDWVLLL